MNEQAKEDLALEVSDKWDRWREENEYDSSSEIPKEILEGIFFALGFLNGECEVHKIGWDKIQNSLIYLNEGEIEDD